MHHHQSSHRHMRSGHRDDDGMFGRDHRRGGGHSRGRGRGDRIFEHGELRLVILALIGERPRHGYELIKAIEDRLGGSYSPSPGVVYPTLTMLEELGHTTVQESAGKKRYTITELGRGFLAENAAAVAAAMARLDARDATPEGPSPQLIRAWENLRLALRLRQAAGPLPAPALQSIVTALDAAAGAVERS